VGVASVLGQRRHEAHPRTTYADHSSHRSPEAYSQRSYVHAPNEAGVAALNDCPVGTRNDRRVEAGVLRWYMPTMSSNRALVTPL
jgi:hypothetical protein